MRIERALEAILSIFFFRICWPMLVASVDYARYLRDIAFMPTVEDIWRAAEVRRAAAAARREHQLLWARAFATGIRLLLEPRRQFTR
jgi:hypothetical protein